MGLESNFMILGFIGY